MGVMGVIGDISPLAVLFTDVNIVFVSIAVVVDEGEVNGNDEEVGDKGKDDDDDDKETGGERSNVNLLLTETVFCMDIGEPINQSIIYSINRSDQCTKTKMTSQRTNDRFCCSGDRF